ncbi:uncharacterized protein TRAVEDRAFT_46075 [Trametes versicolor FP-101664 SS1]|uniref:uncharacterized protein n=1 Tax=Trametes versicolor (strain FP-101664) TaxID=717944 RepID=UPI000462157C|nr:uncharacterized protein TRAVEDRAFT_46075 [Trametes versicolor FP-101664 SS1]EIW60836.1 hypothetical protein TRAVEDRAFT_46075 [Trametes versicolor FP-101664 SS1]
MYFTSFVTLLMPVLAAYALPAPFKPRDGPSQSLNSTSSPTSTTSGTASATSDLAAVNSSRASSLLKALQNEISAVDPSGTAYTAFITTVSSRLAVEMSSIGGSGQVQFVAATATLSTQSHDAPTFTAAPASTGNRANDAASSPTGLPSVPTALASSGGPELSSLLSEIASAELAEVTNVINSASKTAELTAYITEVSGTPYVALSSISGPAITLAATSGAPDAFPTSFDGLAVTAIPSKNAAMGLSVSRSLLAGVVGALGAVGAGAMMIL